MSAGHRSGFSHFHTIRSDCQKLLANPRIRAYLAKPYKVDTSHHIPLTGGSNKAGNIYYLDPRIAEQDRPFVLWHERVEKAARDVFDMSYDRAHMYATCAEHMRLEAAGGNWDEYKKRIGAVVREDEKSKSDNLPSDLDPGPYRESGMTHLLRDRPLIGRILGKKNPARG